MTESYWVAMIVWVQEEKGTICSVFVRYVDEMSLGEYKFKIPEKKIWCHSLRTGTGTSVVADAPQSQQKNRRATKNGLRFVKILSHFMFLEPYVAQVLQAAVVVSEVEAEEAAEEARLNFLTFFCNLTCFSALARQVEEIVEDAVGDAAVVLVGEGEHEVH